MGNHEFCTECGESDFHHGRPCDPVKKATYQARQPKRWKLISSTQFVARPSGDMECFCWRDVSEKDVIQVIGESNFSVNKEWDKKLGTNDSSTLYPGDVIGKANGEKDKKFRFTIIVEELE